MTTLTLNPAPPRVMDVERMLELADFIEGLPHIVLDLDHLEPEDVAGAEQTVQGQMFNMSGLHEDFGCGTVACVAGWALHKYASPVAYEIFGWMETAAKSLGLTERQAHRLFMGQFAPETHMVDITPGEAAAEMRRMVREFQSNQNSAQEISA